MEELLRQHGYNIMISSYHGAVEKEREMFYSMSQRVDAIIYVPSLTTTAWIREVRQMQEKLPIVIFNEALAEECCDLWTAERLPRVQFQRCWIAATKRSA